MKIRNGFVSNSSSSSFICNVCGEEVSGMDMGLHEAEMYQCVNGHTFCEEHALELENKDLAISMVENKISIYEKRLIDEPGDDYYEKLLKQEKEFLAEISEDDYEIDEDQIFEDYDIRYEYPSIGCPICQMTVTMDSDVVEFLLKKHNLTKDEVRIEMKEKFSSYDELKNYIK